MSVLACTDSELRKKDIDDTTEDAQDSDTPLGDTADTDTAVDTLDTADTDPTDVPVIECSSDEVCLEALAPLGICERASCNPTTNRCERDTLPGCCESDNDCPTSGDPCLDNTCLFPGLACVPVDRCEACESDRDCNDIAPSCTTGNCTEGACRFERLETCCIDVTDCDDADICTDARCELGLCIHTDNRAPGCCLRPSVLDTSFSPAPDLVVTSTVTDAGWSARETTFTPSPPSAFYLGNPSTFTTLSSFGPYRAEARFPIGTVRAGSIEIKFQLHIALRPTPDVDRLRIFLRSASGSERNVYSKTVATLDAWHAVKRSLFVDDPGPWELVFAFDSVTVDTERHFGVLLDDLDIKTGCGVEGCESDAECSDSSPCTTDRCVDGTCLQTPDPSLPGCSGCTSDLACDDNRRCTSDICQPNGRCENLPQANCCENDSACEDQNACTNDLCDLDTNRCINAIIADCGNCGGRCDDGNACTSDRCVASSGVCLHDPIADCCLSAGDCDDADLCTTDSCVENRCTSTQIRGCCATDSACNDSDTCTVDACVSNRCSFSPVPECCSTNAQCDDGDACTAEACVGNRCIETPVNGCCTANGQCNDNNACTTDACVGNRCSFNPVANCCSANAQCNDSNACTTDTCTNSVCVFTPTANCCTGNSQCNDNNACTSDTCVGNVCALAPIANCCTADSQCADSDSCTADACIGNRCANSPIPGCCTANSQCNDNNACTSDSCSNGFCTFAAIPNCCNSSAECNDNNLCTTNTCTNNRCVFGVIQGCTGTPCDTSAQCEDNNTCTTNTCTSGVCQTAPAPSLGCCRTSAECNDGSRCTSDLCLAVTGVCVNPSVDCDDGNACTRDRCDPIAGCVHEADPACVCEEAILWRRSFLPEESPDIETDGSGFGLRWRVDDINAFSPNLSLRYGDESGQDYFNGFRTFGRATGPVMTVPSSTVAVRLEFLLHLDIDPEPDSFRARLLVGSQNIVLWDHIELPLGLYGQWVPISVDLPSLVLGEDIQIRFVFDSLDGSGNTGAGIAVDDIVVYTTCQ